MGIQQNKSLMKTFYSNPNMTKDPEEYLQKAFNSECLQLTEFIEKFWNEKALEHLDKTNYLDLKKNTINLKDKDKFYLKEKIIFNEINPDVINHNNSFNLESLSHFRIPFISQDSINFSQTQIKKMNILLIAYIRKVLLNLNENSTIKCITNYFNNEMKNSNYNNNNFKNTIGINLFIKFLSEISKENVKIKEENLNFLLNNSKFIRPLNFFGESKDFFILDKSLDTIIDYLKELIDDKNEKEINKIKALKIIFNLALAKGSLKNLLDVIDSYNKLKNMKIDFSYEINLFKNEFIKFSLSAPEKSNIRIKSDIWNYQLPIEKNNHSNNYNSNNNNNNNNNYNNRNPFILSNYNNNGNNNYNPNSNNNNNNNNNQSNSKNDYYSLTTDGSYLYLFISKGILLKIGTGYNNTMLGKVYHQKENYRVGEKGTLAIVDDVLYYRSNTLDPNPLISINPFTLEEIKNNFEVDYREVNHIFIEEKKSEFEFPHSSYEDLMELIERKKNLGSSDKSNIRPSAASPMLTEGRYIYIVSKWYDELDEEEKKEDDDDGDIKSNNNLDGKKKDSKAIFGVNVYDPLNNMCHLKSIQLNGNFIENENDEDDNNAKKDTINNNNENLLFPYENSDYSLFGNQNNNNNNNQNNNRNRIYQNNNNNNNNNNNGNLWNYYNQNNNNNNNNNNNFNSNNNKKSELNSEFLQNQNELYTNGNILIINNYKFSLVSGHLLNKINMNINRNSLHKCFCYDFKNNLIWCIINESDSKPLKIISFFNKSAKPLLEYPKTHEKYSPCSIDQIISNCETKLKMIDLSDEISMKKFEKQETLNILGLEDENSKNFKQILIENKNANNINDEEYKLNIQCLILNTIAKLSEFYGQVPDLKIATNDIERGRILAQIMRRPFCVKLEPIVFEMIIKFLNLYSKKFLEGNINDTEAYCLLAIVKIIKTNLKCVSISNLSIDYFLNKNTDTNPFLLMKKFIFKIFEIYHNNNNDINNKNEKYNELIKALYEECKFILKVSVNTLYEKFDDIILVLNSHIKDIDNKYNKDIVECILIWLSNEENMRNIFIKTNEKILENLFKIFEIVGEWEIKHVEKFLEKNRKKDNELKDEIYYYEHNEKVAFDFISTFQLELFKNLNTKLLNDNYDDSKYEKYIKKFTVILFDKIQKIFINIKKFLDDFIDDLKTNYDNLYNKKNINEEEIDTSSKSLEKIKNINKTKEKKIPSFNEYKTERITFIYSTFISNLINNGLLSIKTFLFHINSLSILTSNYILSSYLLLTFSSLLKTMNSIYTNISSFIQLKQETKYYKNSEYKEVIYETDHPYTNLSPKNWKLEIPGEDGPLYLEFDSKCKISNPNLNGNGLYFYEDNKMLKLYPGIQKISSVFPKQPLVFKHQPIFASFKNYNKNNEENYGIKMKLHNGKNPNKKKEVFDGFFNLLRTLIWVASKTCAIVIKGNFIKINNEEDDYKKYKSILDSKLFSGGIDYNEIKKENEIMVNNIINIFDEFIDFNKENVKNKNLENEIELFNDKNSFEVIKLFQKKLSEKNPAANVGGEDAFKVVNATFLCLLHHSGEMNNYIEIVNSKPDLNSLVNHKFFESINKKFAIASQMRSWIIEKKKNVFEAIEKKSSNNNNESNNDSEETALNIMKKIVNQTINKSKFLIKIHPSKQLQGNENINTLKSSIISILQENISNKKLLKFIKLNTIRAIGRSIGLKIITEIFENIKNGILLQDLLAWFNSSLRNYNEVNYNNFGHYLDNVSGCGKIYENEIKKNFEKFITLLISKYIQNSNEKELMNFLDSLIWKFGANDHEFLVEKGLFNILYGRENETIKNAWGKEDCLIDVVSKEENKFFQQFEFEKIKERTLINEVIEIFEILSAICFDRVINDDENKNDEKNNKQNENKNDDIQLERNFSSINNNSTSDLIQNILSVIFSEISRAYENYYKFRGISYCLYNQYIKYLEDDILAKKKEKKKKEEIIQLQNQNNLRRYSNESSGSCSPDECIDYEEDFEEQTDPYENENIDNENRLYEVENEINIYNAYLNSNNNNNNNNNLVSNTLKSNKNKSDKNEELPYYFYNSDIINQYDELSLSDIKTNNILKFLGKKNNISDIELISMINSQWIVIYNPKFLNRLLQILYKISIQEQIPIIKKLLLNSDYILNIIQLMKYSSTENKFLLSKILTNFSKNSSTNILNEVCEIYNNLYKTKHENYIELIISIIYSIRKISWCYNKINSNSNYIITNILIDLLKELIYKKKFIREFENLFKTLNIEKDLLITEIVLGIFGGDFQGQSNGCLVRIPSEVSSENSLYGFSKEDYKDILITGNIIGFSSSFNDYFNITQNNSINVIAISNTGGRRNYNWNNPLPNFEKKKNVKLETIYLTPNNLVENQVGVLMHRSLLNTKENFNINDLNPKVYEQYNSMPLIKDFDYSNIDLNKEKICEFIDILINDENNESVDEINLKTNILKFFIAYFSNKKNFNNLFELKYLELINYLIKKGNEGIEFKNSFMNLEFCEEKRFRLINYCNENKESLKEIPKMSISFRNAYNYIFRIFKNKKEIINLCNNIINSMNKSIILSTNNYIDFEIFDIKKKEQIEKILKEKAVIFVDNKSDLDFIIQNILNLQEKNIKNSYIIITDLKIKEFSNNEYIAYVQILPEDLNEIKNIYYEITNDKISMDLLIDNNNNNEKNDNENKINNIINELVNDFGFNRELVIKEVKKNSEKDINTLISNLLENSKNDINNNNNAIIDNNINEINTNNINFNNNMNNINMNNFMNINNIRVVNNNLFGRTFGPNNILGLNFAPNNFNMINNNNIFNVNNNNNNGSNMNNNNVENCNENSIHEEEEEEDDIEKNIENKIKKDKEKDKKDNKRENNNNNINIENIENNENNNNNNNENINNENNNNNNNNNENNNKLEEDIKIEGNNKKEETNKKEKTNKKSSASKENEEILEKEGKNSCFNSDSGNKQNVPEFFEDLFINPNDDKNLLFQHFHNINLNLMIFYSRRIILTLLENSFINKTNLNENENEKEKEIIEKIFSKIENKKMYNIIKLLVHEGLFIHKNNLGCSLLLRIKSLLKNFRKNKNSYCIEMINFFNKETMSEINKVLKNKPSSINIISKNENVIINKPFIFFDIWNLLINLDSDETNHHINFYNIFNNLSGLIPKILEDAELRWFILEILINYSYKILNIVKTDCNKVINELKNEKLTKFEFIPNIKKLNKLLRRSINEEGKKNLSKRTQMITELLMLIADIDKYISESYEISNNNNKESEPENKYIKYDKNSIQYKELFSEDSSYDLNNFIYSLLLTSNIMKNFFDKNYVKYLAWIQLNQEIVNSTKISLESNHLYSKAPHSLLINIPNTSALEINFNNFTYLDNENSINFSFDKKGKNIIKCYVNEDEQNFLLKTNHVFLNFPSPYLTKLYAFGSNSYNRFTKMSSVDLTTPKLITQISNVKIKDIQIGDSFTLILTDNGDIISCGNGTAAGLKNSSDKFIYENKFMKNDKLNIDKYSKICSFSASTILCSLNNNFYSVGMNQNGQIGQNYTSPVNELTSMNFNKSNIKKIIMGETHSFFLCDNGTFYHLGSNDYNQNGEPTAGRNNTPKFIKFSNNDYVEDISCGEHYSIFIIRNLNTNKKELYSAGWSKNHRTGMKEGDIQHLKKIPSKNIEGKEFEKISCAKNCACAISNDGKLYTWGSNIKGQCGQGNYNDVIEPTLVSFFDEKNLEVVDAKMNIETCIVLVRERNNKNKKYVYAMGDGANGKLGTSLVDLKFDKKDTCPIPIRISFFDDKNPMKIFSSARGTIIQCETKMFNEIRDKHNVLCGGTCGEMIEGNLMFDYFGTKKVFCEKCFDENKKCLMFKSPLKDYSQLNNIINKLPKIEEIENNVKIVCENCKDELSSKNSKNYFTYQENNNKDIKFLCDYCVDHFPFVITNAKVYFKSNDYSKILTQKSLSTLNENHFYESSIGYGYKLTITPIYNDKGCENLIKKYNKSFKAFTDELKYVNKFETYEQLVDYLNEMSQKGGKSIFNYSLKDLVFKKESLNIRNELNNLPNETLRKMFILLKVLNDKVKDLLPFIDFSRALNNNLRLSSLFSRIAPLVFWDTKNDIIKYVLEKTSIESRPSELKINRMKVKKFIEKGKPDIHGENTVFGKMFQFLKQFNFKIFRKKKDTTQNANNNNNKLFNVTFQGEASIDAGGPYRECLAQAATELQSSALTLFIPSPNQKSDSGSFREKWIINPSANSITELEMYKIFGGWLGYAIRTGEFINMDLPSIFWKSLLDIPKDRKDLEMIDKYCIQFLDDILKINDPESFEVFNDYKFTTILSSGEEAELIENGKNITLSLENKKLYVELVEKTRLNEGKLQIDAIRSGLEQVIPIGILKLISWNEIEMLVCGKPILDVELLKENTVYRGFNENDTVISYFWKCIEEFSTEERASYLRFVWGRSRLPLTSKDFPMKHRIEIMHHNNPDIALPTSHTCFFSLEIPKYSSYEILHDKLKYAITHCQAIDTDGNAREIWDDEE